jgi:predicted house-cleaning NTP pyrophosphatase (Maf/HAM1 superfamily)
LEDEDLIGGGVRSPPMEIDFAQPPIQEKQSPPKEVAETASNTEEHLFEREEEREVVIEDEGVFNVQTTLLGKAAKKKKKG